MAFPKCWRCKILVLKRMLPGDGDWIYATGGSVCRRCAPNQTDSSDLDTAYDTSGQALKEFSNVKNAEGAKLLFEHAKEYFAHALDTQAVIRDKAKLLLGTTSLTIALISASLTWLKELLLLDSWFPLFLVCALLVSVLTHFIRALILAIVVITRESSQMVATQQIVKTLEAPNVQFTDGDVFRQLAADCRSAASATNRLLIDRKTDLIIAQTSLRWGLTILPGLFLLYVVFVLVIGTQKPPQWATDLDTSVKAVAARQVGTMAANEARLQHLNDTSDSLIAKLADESTARVDAGKLQAKVNVDLAARHDIALREMASLMSDLRQFEMRVHELKDASEQAEKRRNDAQSDLADKIRKLQLRIQTLEEKISDPTTTKSTKQP